MKPTCSLPSASDSMVLADLAPELRVGDVVFIRIGAYPFRQVAAATASWTNHVGIVADVSGPEPLIGESRFPVSGTTTLARFIARSEGRRAALARLEAPLTPDQEAAITAAAASRAGLFYDTGFNLHSSRQFCSRYVREVLQEATATEVGDIESFDALLARQPDLGLGFWKAWYFGAIPWQRLTVTPASLLASPALRLYFDGTLTPSVRRRGISGLHA